MKKYRHRQPKYKKAKRLLNLLKYRRHKKIRESIFNSRKKLAALRAGYNRLKHKYFLKKEKLSFYEIEPLWSSLVQNRWSPQPSDGLRAQSASDPLRTPKPASTEESQGGGAAKSMPTATALLVAKKKYKIHSYLFNVICKFPRKYVYHFFGKDILRKYYTMPFRLNISRFISNKVLRGYYRSLSHKALLNLCQKASRGRRIGLPHAPSFQRGKYEIAHRVPSPVGADQAGAGRDLRSLNFIVQKGTESAERAKNFVLCLEERLDSTLLRLLHFKPLNSFSSVKRALSLAGGRKQKLETNEIKVTKYPKYQIKSPWSYFGAERIRQLISHGHVQINGKKVKSPNTQIRPGDQIKIKGFIVNLAERSAPLMGPKQETSKTMKMNHLFTLLLRRFKDQTYLRPLDTIEDARATEGEPGPQHNVALNLSATPETQASQSDESQESEELLYNYIKGLKIKRFTEAFYMTYRNLHLIERTSSLGEGSVGQARPIGALTFGNIEDAGFENPAGSDRQDFDVEKHIQPVFETIGYNQSIYLLWPVISLLKISPWNSSIKRNLIQSSTRALRPSTRVGFTGPAGADQTRQEQHNIKRKLQNLLKWKKLQTADGVDTEGRAGGTTSKPASGEQQARSTQVSIPNRIRSLILQNPSWLYTLAPRPRGEAPLRSGPHKGRPEAAPSKSFRSYASIVYGTRKCKWIKLQQGSCGAKGSFYNQIPNHTQFFQLELEFFQAVYRGVHGHS